MTTYMHCRPSCATNISTCSSSFIFLRPDYPTALNYQTYTTSPYQHHDQVPTPTLSPPPLPPRRRRRLEDPIITYATNYYATYPGQMSQSPPPKSSLSSSQSPPRPPPRRICQQLDRKDIYCDLFNLLEDPPSLSPVAKQRRRYTRNDHSPRRHHHHRPPMDFEKTYSRVKGTNDRKRNHQKSSYYDEKKRQEDKLPSTEQYDRSTEKTKQINDIYQRRSSNKGFFRRVVGNYFCMLSTLTNNGYSS